MKDELSFFFRSITNSYAAVFFSRSRWFGLFLLCLTMLYPAQGLCGLLCCMLVNSIAISLCLNRYKTEVGLYGFNAVLVGNALGALFPYNVTLIGLLFAVSVLVLLLTIAMDGFFQKYGVPYLAFPFLFCLWLVLLVFQQSDGGSGLDFYLLNDANALSVGGYSVAWFDSLPIWASLPDVVLLYLKSLGFVFFQSNYLTGVLLAGSLLIFSRIASLFSFLGFFFAYFVYVFFGFEMFHIPFICFGFNFIFTSLALGGCYLVPSKTTLMWVFLLVPAQYLVVFSSSRFLSYFMLPTFSLAFCLICVLFLYLLKRREGSVSPKFSFYMEATPEDNVYYSLANRKRFDYLNYLPFSLPVLGTWRISQAYDGAYTHKGLWRHGLDFVIEYDGKQYTGDGLELTDYHCFAKPVVAVADAEVVAVCNDVADNAVKQVDEEHNWGNYVLLKHSDSLYSIVAHLKKGSVRCAVGDRVRCGDCVGLCGNSGLSPYPHLHMQFQAESYVGAPTVEYPFSSFLKYNSSGLPNPQLVGIPKLNDVVGNFSRADWWASAYAFRLGLCVEAHSEKFGTETWQVVSEYGYSLFYCWQTGAKAWFEYRDGDFCFQRYTGTKRCNLYYFFLSNFRVLFLSGGYGLTEVMPLTLKAETPLGWLQDLVVPFFAFMDCTFEAKSDGSPVLKSTCVKRVLGRNTDAIRFETEVADDHISGITVKENRDTWRIDFHFKK